MPTCCNLMSARISLLVVAVLLTSACQLRLDVSVEVNRTGGGVLAVTVGADEELLTAAAQADVDPLERLVQTGQGLRGDGWRVTQRSQSDGQTVVLSREFDDPEEFNAAAEHLAEALAADEVVLLEPLRLQLSDNEVSLEGGAGAQPRRAVRDYGLTRRAAVELINAEQALDYTVTVTLPGETLATTATDADAVPLVWRIPAGEQVTIAARSTRPGPPILRAVAGALGGALVAGVALWLWSRRRGRPAA
jgi:hypothetical protein